MRGELDPTALERLVDVREDWWGGRRPGKLHDPAPHMRRVLVDESQRWVA